MTAPKPVSHQAGRRAVEILLWFGAGLGTLSLLAALAAVTFGIVPLVFTSGSMSPEVPTGSLGLARTVAASELHIGDVVSVTAANDTRVTHRVVATEQQSDVVALTLKGDTNPGPDQETYTVKEADRVFFTAPYLGRIITVLTSPWGMFLGGLTAAAVLFWAFRRGPSAGADSESNSGSEVEATQQTVEAPPAKPGTRRKTKSRTSATLLAVGIPALLLTTASSGTAAFFTDAAEVTTTGFATHRVLQPDPITCTATANTITISTTQNDQRYSYWARTYTAAEGGNGVSSYKKMSGNPATVTFNRSEFNPALGVDSSYWVHIHSRVGATGTTGLSGWESAEYRRQAFGWTGTTLNCGEYIPPKVTFTQPLDGSSGSKRKVGGLLAEECGGRGSGDPLACGTATDANGTVTSIQYIFQRSSILGTDCWNGNGWGNACGYRDAARGTDQNLWSVPGSYADPYKSSFGSYKYALTIKATDNDGYVSEKSINYKVGL